MSNKHIDSIQFETLKIEVESLDEVSVLLNLLYTRTNLGLVEDCEIELALRGIGTLLNNSNASDADIDELAGLNKVSDTIDALKAQDLSDKIKESQKTIETKKKAISDEFDKIGVAKSFDSKEQAERALKNLEEGTPSGLKKFNPFYSSQALKGRYEVVQSEHVNKGKYYIVDDGSVKEAETIKEAIDTAIKAKDHAKIKEEILKLVGKYEKLGVSKSDIKTLKAQAELKGDFSDERLTALKKGLASIENGLKEEKEEYVKKLGNSGVINRYNKLSKSKELANKIPDRKKVGISKIIPTLFCLSNFKNRHLWS